MRIFVSALCTALLATTYASAQARITTDAEALAYAQRVEACGAGVEVRDARLQVEPYAVIVDCDDDGAAALAAGAGTAAAGAALTPAAGAAIGLVVVGGALAAGGGGDSGGSSTPGTN